jgi:hypothetical protein
MGQEFPFLFPLPSPLRGEGWGDLFKKEKVLGKWNKELSLW